MALHYFKGACQISRILPMYVSHLLHYILPTTLAQGKKRAPGCIRVLRVEYFVLGLSAVSHNLFVPTGGFPYV